MMRFYGYFSDLLIVLAVGGCLVSFAGCETEIKQGKFTDDQMDRFVAAPQMDLPNLSGGVVLSIGNETITAEEVLLLLEATEQRRRPAIRRDLPELAKSLSIPEFFRLISDQTGEIVIGKATNILLYEKAKAEAGDRIEEQLDKFVEAEKNSFIARHGNNYAEAEKSFKRDGITDWKAFEDRKKEEMLTQMYLSKRTGTTEPIAYNRLKAYYDENKEKFQIDGTMDFLLIDIVPSKLKPDQIDIAMGQSAEAAAVQLANKLVEELRGGEDFGKMVGEISNGIYAGKGGAWGTVTLGALIKPYDVLEGLAENTAVGDVSDPVEVNGHVFIMKLLEYNKGGTQAFPDVRDEIKSELEYVQRMKQTREIFSEVMSETNVGDLEKFVDMCVAQAYRHWSGK